MSEIENYGEIEAFGVQGFHSSRYSADARKAAKDVFHVNAQFQRDSCRKHGIIDIEQPGDVDDDVIDHTVMG